MEPLTDELPCKLCGCGGYGEYKPQWCRVLGKTVTTIKDIPMYHDIIPGLKSENGCMAFTKKV